MLCALSNAIACAYRADGPVDAICVQAGVAQAPAWHA
jgi:hypothetical protein